MFLYLTSVGASVALSLSVSDMKVLELLELLPFSGGTLPSYPQPISCEQLPL